MRKALLPNVQKIDISKIEIEKHQNNNKTNEEINILKQNYKNFNGGENILNKNLTNIKNE